MGEGKREEGGEGEREGGGEGESEAVREGGGREGIDMNWRENLAHGETGCVNVEQAHSSPLI